MFAAAWVIAGVDAAKAKIRNRKGRQIVAKSVGDSEERGKIFVVLMWRGVDSVRAPSSPRQEQGLHWGLVFAGQGGEVGGARGGELELLGKGTMVDVTDDHVMAGEGVRKREWRFRREEGWDVKKEEKVVGIIQIGEMECGRVKEVVDRLTQLRVSRKEAQGEDCARWVLRAVEQLKERGYVGSSLDVDGLHREVVRVGDEAMEELKTASNGSDAWHPRITKYTEPRGG